MKATKKQILDYITDYLSEHGYSPTTREIGDGVGLNSTSTVNNHVRKMLESGMLETDTEGCSPRALRVPGMKFVRKDAVN